jgi:hypothetical protein
MGRERMIEPVATGIWLTTAASTGSPSSDSVCGMKP